MNMVLSVPKCSLCNRENVVLIWHPMLGYYTCMVCLRDKKPAFFQAIRLWCIHHGKKDIEVDIGKKTE